VTQAEVSLPAVIFCDPETAGLQIAGLPVLDRLIVAAHRAGAAPITVVSSGPLPPLPRATALDIKHTCVAAVSDGSGPTLALSTHLLVQTGDLKTLIKTHGRLVKRDGTALPAGVVNGRLSANLEELLCALPHVVAQGVAEPIAGAKSVPAVSRALWGSLTSSSDGFVDKHFNRPVGRLLSKLLVHTPVSPNQVSVSATVLGLISAWLFARGNERAALWGAILLQVSAMVDCVDGDLARVLFKESPLGKWLDIAGDQLVHIGVFAAIGIGLYRTGSESPVLALAVSAVIGVVISFIVVLRGLRLLELRRNHRLQKLIDATTNRDFSVLLIALTLLGKLEWFLWATAIGVHVFWLVALAVQAAGQAEPTNERAT